MVFLFLTPVLFALGNVTVHILLWARLQSRLAWNGLLVPASVLIDGAAGITVMFFKPSFLPMTVSSCAWLFRPYVAISRALVNLHLKQDSSVYCYVVTALVTTGSISFFGRYYFSASWCTKGRHGSDDNHFPRVYNEAAVAHYFLDVQKNTYMTFLIFGACSLVKRLYGVIRRSHQGQDVEHRRLQPSP